MFALLSLSRFYSPAIIKQLKFFLLSLSLSLSLSRAHAGAHAHTHTHTHTHTHSLLPLELKLTNLKKNALIYHWVQYCSYRFGYYFKYERLRMYVKLLPLYQSQFLCSHSNYSLTGTREVSLWSQTSTK